MKLKQVIFLLLFLLAIFPADAQDLQAFMKEQPQIKKIEKIDGNPFFKATYQLLVRQPLNAQDTTDGFFLQRVFVAEKAPDKPTVLITEGYAANYAATPEYINELSEILDGNQICVEHRYFGQSKPEPLNWEDLTVENAAADHHRIVELFKPYFSGKWLNTGISKGGQTALAHRTIFPDDVDLTVAYVAPLNFGVEDGRHEAFIRALGSDSCQQAILQLQQEFLKRRKAMTGYLKNYCQEKGYHSRMNYDEMLDYLTLEFPFAFWQWGASCSQIPDPAVDDSTLYCYFTKISEPDYFTDEGSKAYQPFFYQAVRELGYYGYDAEPLTGLISVDSTQGYLAKYMLPEDCQVSYHPETSLLVDWFLKNQARNVMLIYGQTDPWSATAAELNDDPSNWKIVAPGGSHRTRIRTLDEATQQRAVAFIRKIMQ
ncbi:S28 family serine protease [Mangrovibacterium marinum]|uniref:PS-10 peptidase S37 n=1 Tax=Mangrovibacterium marinum TaxID=1639118 RepID=A0A2T5C640_9BACT|nr:S28 family serine protease [Mangrovibacterium marinum]PTN10413.1 PS-10 peptidase S37 [Mangrovibacterium marinum]